MEEDKIVAVKASITNIYPIKQKKFENIKLPSRRINLLLRITWFNMPYLRNRLKRDLHIYSEEKYQ